MKDFNLNLFKSGFLYAGTMHSRGCVGTKIVKLDLLLLLCLHKQ